MEPLGPAATSPGAVDPPTVVLLANSYAPYLIHLCRRIAAELHEVTFYTLFSHETGNAAWAFRPPAEIRPVSFGPGERAADLARPSNALHEWSKGGRIIQWLIDHRARAVVVAGYNDPGRLRIIRWCRRHGVACFVWGDSNIRGDRARGIKAWIKRLYIAKVLRWSAGAMPFGTLGADYFARYGASRDTIFLMPFEPDYDLIQQMSGASIEKVAQQFNLPSNRRRILFSGRLVSAKRPDLLIEAFKAIAGQRPQWDLLIIGDGPLREQLQAALPPQLQPRVTWTGFLDDQPTVSALYRSADVLALPSDYEPWALVINEAAAAGLAIVCSDVVGAAAELVRGGINGFLFQSGNLNELIDRLLKVTAPERIDAMKHASLQALSDWRVRGDPVTGLRKALQNAGVC